MSDLTRALVPVAVSQQRQSVLAPHSSQAQEASLAVQPRRKRRQPQQIPSSPSHSVGFSVIVRCVTNRPVSFLISPTRGVIMDPNNFNGYNANQNNYAGYGSGFHSQGQGGYHSQQQQFPQNQNQPRSGNGPAAGGGNANFNHYHGSHFNFTFSNSGAYDLNIRIPGLIGGGNNGMPYNQNSLQSANSVPNPGLGFGNNNQQGQGFGVAPSYGSYLQQLGNMNQQPQQHSDFYNRQGQNGPIVMPGAPQQVGQGLGFNNGGQDRLMQQQQSQSGLSGPRSLRRTHSSATLLSDEFADDECFGSQNSKRV